MEKAKYEEYVRLHRLVTGVTARRIWDMLRHSESLGDLIYRVPEEFKKWVLDTEDQLKSQFDRTQRVARDFCERAKDLASRKEQALFLNVHCPYPGIVFKMLDDQPYDQIIWKLLKPKAERPYREDL